MNKQLLITITILLFLISATALVIAYGKGYRFGFDRGRLELSGTGLLVVSSIPDGAQVFVNDTLTTASNDTINLFPGEYTIRIYKEGYFPWEKKITVQKEVVAKAQAYLFPTTPKLESITSSGVQTPVIDPSFTKLAYTVSSQTPQRNGVYVLDMTTRPILTLQSASRQIINDTSNTFSSAQLAWSPDGRELIASVSANTYLLQASGFNSNLQDVTTTLASVKTLWEREKAEADKARLSTLKPNLQELVSENFAIVSWSPDKSKILYQASQSATLDLVITPRLLGVDATPEDRDIQKDSVYIYDIKEDKNYKLPVPPGVDDKGRALQWLPNSHNILFTHDKKIQAMDYDGTNVHTLYAGPFLDSYVFPWPSGMKVVILTDLGNSTISPNLYIIDLE